MPWGKDKESQLRKYATQTLVFWADGVKEKGEKLGFGFDEVVAMEVQVLLEAMGLRLAVSTQPTDKIADDFRTMLFDWMKMLRQHAHKKHGISLEPH